MYDYFFTSESSKPEPPKIQSSKANEVNLLDLWSFKLSLLYPLLSKSLILYCCNIYWVSNSINDQPKSIDNQWTTSSGGSACNLYKPTKSYEQYLCTTWQKLCLQNTINKMHRRNSSRRLILTWKGRSCRCIRGHF